MTSLNQTLGGLTLPTASGDVTADALAPLDPGRDILLALFKAALNAELAGAWNTARSGTPLSASSPVQTALPFCPDPDTLLQYKAEFPLLCVYRSEEQPGAFSQWSLERLQYTGRIDVDYILGPMSIVGHRRLGDAIILAAKTIALTIHNGGHPAYSKPGASDPGGYGQRGYAVLGPWTGGAGFSRIDVSRVTGGTAQAVKAPNGPKYLALSMSLAVTELSSWADGAAASLNGASLTFATGDSSGLIANFIEAITEETHQSPLGIP